MNGFRLARLLKLREDQADAAKQQSSAGLQARVAEIQQLQVSCFHAL